MRESEDPPMAIDNPPGDPRPRYDQYALNDPDSRNKPAQIARRARGAPDEEGAEHIQTAAAARQQVSGSFGSARPGDISSRPERVKSDAADGGETKSSGTSG